MTTSRSGGSPDTTLGGILTCTSLPDPAHELLGYLTTTAKRRKHALTVMTGPTEWAQALAWEPETARTWRDDLIDWGYLHSADGRLILTVACTCEVLSVEKLAQLAPPVSATKLTSSGATRVGAAPHLGEDAEHTPPVLRTVKSNPRTSSLDTKPVVKWSARDLACYFNKALAISAQDTGRQVGPGGYAPLAVMVSNISRWFRDEPTLGPETVKAMVDRFLGHVGEYTAEGQPAWKAFLSRRQSLWHAETQAAKRDLSRDISTLVAERTKAHTDDRHTIDQMMAEREAYLAQGAN